MHQIIKMFVCQTFIDEQAPAGTQMLRKTGQNSCSETVNANLLTADCWIQRFRKYCFCTISDGANSS